MLKHRVIPALLLCNGGLVKTIKFKNPQYVGDPINTIRIFNEKEVDELLVIDIEASKNGRGPDFGLVEEFASECFIPLTYGGGISSVEQAERLFKLGVEKICLQTSIISDSSLLQKITDRFGSQSVVASVDIKRDWFGRPSVYSSVSRKILPEPWLQTLERLVSAGAGEILLNSVDKDGTLSGCDLDLTRVASSKIQVPLITLGGVSGLQDIKNAVSSGASAVAAGSFFVFHGPHRAVLITYPDYQDLEKLFEEPL